MARKNSFQFSDAELRWLQSTVGAHIRGICSDRELFKRLPGEDGRDGELALLRRLQGKLGEYEVLIDAQ